MRTRTFTYGIEFAYPAGKQLLESGQLGDQWVSAFLSLIDLFNWTGDSRLWPGDYFKLLRFVSVYLPLRYWAWSRTSGSRNARSEGMLATLGSAVEETLWGAVVGHSYLETDLDDDELRLSVLVFGDRTPLHATHEELAKWEQEYLRARSAIAIRWNQNPWWPRWPSLAMHFASFYLIMALSYDIGEVELGSGSTDRQRLHMSLSDRIGADNARIVATWLATTDMPRDEAGIPIVGSRKRQGMLSNVRLQTEALLVG